MTLPPRGVERLLAIMAALRDPETGCSWDRAQTHQSLTPYALEEAYEVVDAIERRDMDDLRDELGDLLLQVVFHARMAEEAGAFDFGGVVAAISEKMVRRHPHIFTPPGAGVPAPLPATDEGLASAKLVRSWDAIKAEERRAKRDARSFADGGGGVLANVPIALPALVRAVKLQTRAARVGFDWVDARDILAKIREEIDEVERELDGSEPGEALTGEIGDLLFAVANLARRAGVDPETAVRATNAKFIRRFAFIEAELARRGSSAASSSLAEMDELWSLAKMQGL